MRFIKVLDGKMQTSAQESPSDLEGLSIEEAGKLGWYQVIETVSKDIPSCNESTQILNEYNYTINDDLKTATPLIRVEDKYNTTGTEYEKSCPQCFAEYISSDDRNDNVVKQALAKGELKKVGLI